MPMMMAALSRAQDRVAFAAEGVGLVLADAWDGVRNHRLAVTAIVAALAAAAALALSLDDAGRVEAGGERAAAPPAPQPGFVERQGYSLSMPPGWTRAESPKDAAFAASSASGLAEATLWIERAPGLPWDAFVRRSVASLDEIGADVRVTDRLGGPGLASRITTLRAEVPLDGGAASSYTVTLRADGPFRHYMATATRPGASASDLAGAEIIATTFRPETHRAPLGRRQPR